MTESNLVDVLGRQTTRPVGLVDHVAVRSGHAAVSEALQGLVDAGYRHAVVDAATESDLDVIGLAVNDHHVLTGGAGLARGLARARINSGSKTTVDDVALPTAGPVVILAGSCSAATIRQVRVAAAAMPSHRLDPGAVANQDDLVDRARRFLDTHADADVVMLYSTASRADRQASRSVFGGDTAAVLEDTMGRLAKDIVQSGVRRLVVAGGETAGAVVSALDIDTMLVADELDPGVPWCVTQSEPSIALLLKSGNFGRDDVFIRAAGLPT